MALILLKKFSLLFLFISASLLSTSFAGRQAKLINNLAADVDLVQEEETPLNEEEVINMHERLLRANAGDYGRYDPTPVLSKPPFKLIPN
ncbi:protein CASPARIAN STRIP INTEGRITY FACTOR 1-like [Lotus japonicus]|uniref:protein CASPARIAN STRIP INTEGRITY FACTOR 1-like n=1 Tax=Lotus japonicus TaxID=34305 RepID=UPI00258A7A86|nr:protein CASPARIAN STRIP INTEGRITY FACTOR 1-like [Lotus japonicus]